MNRINIRKEMKNLCKTANVDSSKVFPHNLRHLFARVFYGIDKDIAEPADILGHGNINTIRIYIFSTALFCFSTIILLPLLRLHQRY